VGSEFLIFDELSELSIFGKFRKTTIGKWGHTISRSRSHPVSGVIRYLFANNNWLL